MSALKVTKVHPLAKRGEPWVPIVRIPVGEHAVSKYPDWAVARLIELGHAELIEGQKVRVDDNPEAAAALEAAKAEEATMRAAEAAKKAEKADGKK